VFYLLCSQSHACGLGWCKWRRQGRHSLHNLERKLRRRRQADSRLISQESCSRRRIGGIQHAAPHDRSFQTMNLHLHRWAFPCLAGSGYASRRQTHCHDYWSLTTLGLLLPAPSGTNHLGTSLYQRASHQSCPNISSIPYGLSNEMKHEAVAFVDAEGTRLADMSECRGGSTCTVPIYLYDLIYPDTVDSLPDQEEDFDRAFFGS
jgi:hypothetical protein